MGFLLPKMHSGRFLLKIGINSKNAKFELTASHISIQESTHLFEQGGKL
jgi:hypothetical protein